VCCDDGNLVPDDGCNIACKRDALFVFVSNEAFPITMLGSLLAADAHCMEMAKAGQQIPDVARNSSYDTWLSDGVTHAGVRLGTSTLPYRRTDFVVVAASTLDLVNNRTELSAPINRDQHGGTNPGGGDDCGSIGVWTGSHWDGVSTMADCSKWMSPIVATKATVGNAFATDDG